jgi:hypothetical protein
MKVCSVADMETQRSLQPSSPLVYGSGFVHMDTPLADYMSFYHTQVSCLSEMCTIKYSTEHIHGHNTGHQLPLAWRLAAHDSCYLRSEIFEQEPGRTPSACSRTLDAPRGRSPTTAPAASTSNVGSCASTATYWSSGTGPTTAVVTAASDTSTASVTASGPNTSRRVLVRDSGRRSSGLAHWSAPQLTCYHGRWGCLTPSALGTTQLAKWTK